MNNKRFASLAFALILGAAALAAVPASAAPANPAPTLGQDRDDWNHAPREFNDLQRRGFQDGLEGARRDFGNHRRPDVNNREEYRYCRLPDGEREPYKAGFRRGYEVAARHLWDMPQAPPPPPQYAPPMPPPQQPRPNWEQWAMRGLESEAEIRGYREGAEAARQDAQYQRRPDPDNHEEYRNPRVAPGLVDEYRGGFMRGYEATASQLSGEPDWRGGDDGRSGPPSRYSEWQRRGFADGADGARKDYGNNRRPNPNNRDEYRSPNVPPQVVDAYREGFRRGYELTVTQLYGGGDRR